jgi:tetratricopeptide (TPR) repeat protein
MKRLIYLIAIASTMAKAELPHISLQSEQPVTVNRTDTLVLSVTATGENLQYQWIRNHETVCQEAECRIDTADWQLGRHSIVTMVYNAEGSAKTDFTVQIMPEPADYTPKEIKPSMTKAKKPKNLNLKTDISIRSTRGVGYSKKGKDVKVIGRTARALQGDEEVKSQEQAIVVVSKDREFEHILLSLSDVTLVSNDETGIALNLKQGILRSRQIASKKPEWSIVMDRKVTVSGNQDADFVIIKDHENRSHFQLITLRGETTITLPNATQQSFQAGTMVVANHTTISSRLWRPYFKIMQYLFLDSSPQYILRKQQTDGSRNTSFVLSNIAAIAKRDFQTNFKSAQDTFANKDYIVALEYLLPLYAKNKDNYELNLMLARVYTQLGVYPQAVRFYQEAIRIDPKSFDAHYQILELYTESRNWDKAIEWSKKAYRLKEKGSSNLAYYSAVAYHNKEQRSQAQKFFQEAVYDSTHEEIKISAQEFLDDIAAKKKFSFLGYMHLGQDSNVYRFPSKGKRNSYYEGEGSLFLQTGFQAAYNAFTNKLNHLKFGFDLDKVYYLDSKFKDVEKLEQKLYLDWALYLNSYAGFGISPYIHIMTFGKNRALDTFGFELRYVVSQTKTQVKLMTENTSDPIPGQFDKLEPHTHEPVAPTDRSGSVTRFHVIQDILDSKASALQATFKYNAVGYSQTKNTDFSDIAIGGDYRYRGLASSTIPASLYITQRSYDKDAGMIIDLETGYLYHFNPRWTTGLMLDYRTSGVKDREYDQQLIYTTLQVEL